jgi:hypothetical protein
MTRLSFVGELIAFATLAAAVIFTCFVVHERGMEEMGLRALIRAEVKAEMNKRYRNIPNITVGKVYTLHATGKDVVIDTDEEARNVPRK